MALAEALFRGMCDFSEKGRATQAGSIF